MSMLEQIAYQLPRIFERRQVVYQTGDLESLSSVALYSDGDKTDFNNGKIESILPKIDGFGTLKIYIDPFTFEANAGYQRKGESHDEYKKRMKETGGISMGGGIAPPPSGSAGGY